MSVLWDIANKLIPGGNMLFSKTPLRYCPGRWPSHYQTAHGITITDTHQKTYRDFSVFGAGNSVLGYNDPDVCSAVVNAIYRGNVSTLNCPEEVYLAEEILNLNPKMDMVRFGRSGNDACQIAKRIAQEYSGKTKFAICGYHGWQIGHPPQLDPDCVPFDYGDIDGFMDNLRPHETAFVMMECVRSKPVDIEFLKAVRKETERYNIPLIFDEVASGFRCNLGGYHQTIGIYPDMVLYGKAMGNGFAISAVLGKAEIMEKAKNTFISSMQWSERIGYAAGLATIEKMRECNAQERMCATGKRVKGIWKDVADECLMDMEIQGLDPLASFNLNDPNREIITTFTQEMLKRNMLASNQFYASVAHTKEDIDDYEEAVHDVFIDIVSGKAKLEGKPAIPGFTRLV